MATDQIEQKPATIIEAHRHLSRSGFASWMCLMFATDGDLTSGRSRMARVLGYSIGRSNVILRELSRKGYIKIHPPEQIGMNTHFEILRRAIISGPNRFVRLS